MCLFIPSNYSLCSYGVVWCCVWYSNYIAVSHLISADPLAWFRGTAVYTVCIHKRLCLQAGMVPFKGTFGVLTIMLFGVTSHIALYCTVQLVGKISYFKCIYLMEKILKETLIVVLCEVLISNILNLLSMHALFLSSLFHLQFFHHIACFHYQPFKF